MKVIKKGDPWKKVVDCDCGAQLELDEADIYRNPRSAGQLRRYRWQCPECYQWHQIARRYLTKSVICKADEYWRGLRKHRDSWDAPEKNILPIFRRRPLF